MTAAETQVLMTRLDGLHDDLGRLRKDVQKLDERQRAIQADLHRLTATAQLPAPPPSLIPSKGQAVSTGGMVVLATGLLELVRYLVMVA